MRRDLRGLYVIIDPEAVGGRDELRIARAALDGGARIIQLRDKHRPKGVQLPLARALRDACHQRGAVFIVNDHADLALVSGADGLHVGQNDLPVAEVRRIVPPEMIVGASTNNLEEAHRAVADGADYIAVGRLFPTTSKDHTRPATLEILHAINGAVNIPVCGIGGINADNIRSVIDTGAQMAAVIGAVCAAPDPRAAAARLAAQFETMAGR
jgi:thiamine-phosphate diphosphorylase